MAISLMFALLFAGDVTAREDLQAGDSEYPYLGFDDGLLSLDIRGTRLSEVLRAIAEKTGVDVRTENDFDEPVTVSFARLPLTLAFKRLLGQHSYLVYFDNSKQVTALRVLKPPDAGTGNTHQPMVSNVDDTTETDLAIWILDRLTSAEQNDRIVAVRRLAELDSKVAVDMAGSILLSDPSPVVRREAVLVLEKIGGDSIIGLLETVMTDVDSSVRLQAIQVWLSQDGEQAVGALGRILREDPDRQVRLTALKALKEMDGDGVRYYFELARLDQEAEIREFAEQVIETGNAAATGQAREEEAPAPSAAAIR